MHVGIFGGSFNPPHIAHLIIAELIRDQFNLNRVTWIPSYQPPHKQITSLVSFEHRLEMTRLAVSDNPRFEVSDIERNLGGVSYTVMTLRALQEMHPQVEYSLILGGDSMQNFDSWFLPEEILERVRLIVYNRPGIRLPETIRAHPDRIVLTQAPLLEVAAEKIRERRRTGQSIRYLVTGLVLEYIEANGLYL